MQAFRHGLVIAINRASERIPKRALSVLQSAKKANVRYEVAEPFGREDGLRTTDFACSDRLVGDPEDDFEATVTL